MTHKEIEPDIGYIQLIGRLDILAVEEIEQNFNILTSGQKKSVIVDLSGLELLNSIGLGMFITNAKNLASYGKRMILLQPKPRIETVVRMAGIDQLLLIEQDLDAALKRIKDAG
jgi:anti-anti-sigma factor